MQWKKCTNQSKKLAKYFKTIHKLYRIITKRSVNSVMSEKNLLS